MSGLSDRSFFLLAVLVYGAATVYSIFLWRQGLRRDNRILYILLFAGVGLHTMAMGLRGFSFSRCPVTNLYEATIFSAWTTGAIYLVVGLVRRFRFLGIFASPILFGLGVFALMPGLDEHSPHPQFTHGLSSLHASLILLSYGAFGLASVAAALYLTQEKGLKLRRHQAIFAFLPPIERLETVTQRMLLGGWILLSVGLLFGTAWLRREKGVYFTPDPKILWSALIWLVYATLLVVRWRTQHGGRRFAWGTIGTFTFLMLTFWGSNLLSEIHNPPNP